MPYARHRIKGAILDSLRQLDWASRDLRRRLQAPPRSPGSACRQKRRVRFTTAAALGNELVEAKQNNQVRRLMARWQKYELIALDEVGYVPLADIGAEFLFQVISERAERAAIIVTDELAVFRMALDIPKLGTAVVFGAR